MDCGGIRDTLALYVTVVILLHEHVEFVEYLHLACSVYDSSTHRFASH